MIDMENYHRRNKALIGLLLLVMVGCAAVGAPAPQGTEQGIAYIYPANATIREAATSALQAKVINKAEAETVLKLTDQARSAADIAKDFARTGNQSRAEASLTLARSVLREARKFINLPEDPQLR